MTTTTCPTCKTPGIGDAASCDHGFGDYLARVALMIEARGSHGALAAVRKQIADSIDAMRADLRRRGVPASLLNEWDDEADRILDPYRAEVSRALAEMRPTPSADLPALIAAANR